MTKIDELKKLAPQQRAERLEQLFQKNKNFFTKRYPSVAKLLVPGGSAPFHIHVADDFLTITNTETGELCHPEAGLDCFAEALGDWTNNAWIDLIEGRIVGHKETTQCSQMPMRFQRAILNQFPGLAQRLNDRTINLPTLSSGKRFSNPVMFVGLFHGLHIDYYLSRTQLRNVAFIEPDCARFAVSCYFLDYQVLDERFDGLVLHVGGEVPESFALNFLIRAPITAPVWVRVLPGYVSDKFEPLLRQLRLSLRKVYDVWMPAEWQLDGLCSANKNVRSRQRVYARTVKLSSRSRIVVIGAGPSLSNDLDWLKQNKDQFIIFAVHSSVSALQKNGINPDFQLSLDINPWDQKHFDRLQLDPSLPIITLINDLPYKFDTFKEVLRVAEFGGVYPVHLKHMVPFLSPTSGNMALGLACYCKPEEVYLIGLDLGYRESSKTHAAESSVYNTEEEHKSILGSGHLQVESNFNDTEDIYTQSYFNLARIAAQQPISAVAGQVKVFNCSDGVRIDGAVPCHSSEIELRDYDKSQDVDLIRSMFVPLEEGIHWHTLPLDGATQLEVYKKAILSELKLKKFNWLKFSEKIDNFKMLAEKQMPRSIVKNRNRCISPYLEVVKELLNCWYRLLCFTNTESEWQRVYDVGYAQLTSLLDEFEWPENL